MFLFFGLRLLQYISKYEIMYKKEDYYGKTKNYK